MHDTQQHTRIDKCSLQSPRWWSTPAAAGLVVTTTLVAILTSAAPGRAIPIEVDRFAGSAPALPAISTTVRPGRVPVAQPPDLPDGWRQCFMWQPHWNTALHGPQPLCPQDPDGDEGCDADESQAQPTASGSDHAKAEAVGHSTGLSLRPSAKWVPLP
jgi:hypothetical protein